MVTVNKISHDPVERVLGEAYVPYFPIKHAHTDPPPARELKTYDPNGQYDLTPAAGK